MIAPNRDYTGDLCSKLEITMICKCMSEEHHVFDVVHGYVIVATITCTKCGEAVRKEW